MTEPEVKPEFRWLSDLPRNYKAAWIAEGMLTRRGLTVLLGAPKARKSTLRRYIVGCALSGKPIFGAFSVSPVERALVWIGESVVEGESAMHHTVMDSLGGDSRRLAIGKPEAGFSLAAPRDFRRLYDLVHRERFDLVVLDPLINFHSEDENDASGLGKVCQALLELGEITSVLIVHHTAKPSEADNLKTVGQRARGSSVLPGSADTSLLLTRPLKGDHNKLLFETRHAAEPPPMDIAWDPKTGLWAPYRPVALVTKVQELLAASPDLSANDVAKALGGKRELALLAYKQVKQGELDG